MGLYSAYILVERFEMERNVVRVMLSMGIGTVCGMGLINLLLPPQFGLLGAALGALIGVALAFISKIFISIIPASREVWAALDVLPSIWVTIKRPYTNFQYNLDTLGRWQFVARISKGFAIVQTVVMVLLFSFWGVFYFDIGLISFFKMASFTCIVFGSYAFFTILSLEDGLSDYPKFAKSSFYPEEEKRKITQCKHGIFASLPIVGLVYFMGMGFVLLIPRIPGYLKTAAVFVGKIFQLVGDILQAVPLFLFSLIKHVYSSIMWIMLIYGFVGILVAQRIFVEILDLQTAQYLVLGFVFGCFNGYLQFELISKRIFHLQPNGAH